MNIASLRNLGIVAHIDAGKTTVSERILFFSGVEHRIGEVDDGTAVMDWMPEERERGISITAAATTLVWRGHTLNLIDTPGHVDFTIEVERSLRVLDGAVLVIDAVAGVQAQSETVWRQMRRHHVPSLAFVNKCDRAGADFLAALASLRRRLDAPAVAIQYPWFREQKLVGVVDLLRRRAIEFDLDPTRAPVETDVPEALVNEIGVLRSDLLDALADGDEAILAAVLEERDVPLAELRAALRKATIESRIVPVLAGAAFKNVGVQPLLDAVVDYLPSPLDVPPIGGTHPETGAPETRACDVKARTAALAFKLHAEAHGDLTFVRIYAGVLMPGEQLVNPRTKKLERIARLLRLHADQRTPIETAGPGEIVGVQGLKFTATGDTLCDPGAPLVLERLTFPEPVIAMVLEPASSAEREKLGAALRQLTHEDPSFHAREDESTGQWSVSGMGELHLEVMLHRLASEFHVKARMGKPRVAYREAVRRAGAGSGRVERLLGGKEIFGAVDATIEPAREFETGVDVVFEPECKVPNALRETVRESLALAAQVGPRFGFPLVQARVRLSGGESRPRVDSELGFIQAANLALKDALERAEVDLLEPLMSFEIHVPAEFSSGVIADLNGRQAEVAEVLSVGTDRRVVGKVPLYQMFGYSTVVRSLSQGRAGHSLQPAGFAPVPEAELAARGLVWT
ncbi:MAG: elongation factor G [Planctomycetes bacterium]|nr:elongation factor G [Planctomycetota bacterium]